MLRINVSISSSRILKNSSDHSGAINFTVPGIMMNALLDWSKQIEVSNSYVDGRIH